VKSGFFEFLSSLYLTFTGAQDEDEKFAFSDKKIVRIIIRKHIDFF
jgi:hypothetical protein